MTHPQGPFKSLLGSKPVTALPGPASFQAPVLQEASISIPQTSTARSSSEAETRQGDAAIRKVHFILNSKGGVGKSFVAFLLALHLREPVLCFVIRPSSRTLHTSPLAKWLLTQRPTSHTPRESEDPRNVPSAKAVMLTELIQLPPIKHCQVCASKSASLKLTRPSTLLLNTQTEREAMGHLSKYYPIRSRSSGVSNQGRTRHHDTLPVVRRNKPVQQRNADDGFWLLKRRLPQTLAQQASKKQVRELLTCS